MGARRKFSAEYKREAVAMLDAPGVTVSQIAADLGMGANVLARWRRGIHRHRPEHQMGDGHHLHPHRGHWLYLCIVLDLYSGLVVGWSMSPRQDRHLVVQAVLMAVWQRPGRAPVILHSDRGGQFTSEEYQQFLAAHQVTCSMSAVGSCADNAAAESFFGVLKRERVNRRQYRTRAEARADLFDYIERWHNPRQRRRLAFQQEGEKLLTQVSAEMG